MSMSMFMFMLANECSCREMNTYLLFQVLQVALVEKSEKV